jgi:hypothetical protein
MGISYEEINVWVFVIIGPLLLLASLFANVVLWRKRSSSRLTVNERNILCLLNWYILK